MSTPRRKVIITFVADNEIKLSGATALVKDVITHVADEHGLDRKYDGNERAWHVWGDAKAINDFINDFRKAVSDKVEVVVDMTKKLKAEEEEEEAEEEVERKPTAKPETKPEVKPEAKAAKQELPTTPVPAITLVQEQKQPQQVQAQAQPQPQPQPQQQAKPEKAIDVNKLLIAGLTIMNVGVEVMLMALMNNINSDEASKLMKHVADVLDEVRKILTA